MVRTSDVRVEQETRSRIDYVVDLLAEYKIGVYLTIISVTVLVATGRWSIPSLAPWQERVLTGFSLLILPSIILGKKAIVEKFIPDTRYKVLEIDPDRNMAIRGVKLGRRLWETRETGEYPAFAPPAGNIDFVVTSLTYHPSDEDGPEGAYLDVEGCNPEIANPVNLLALEGKLDDVYNELLIESKKLTQTEATLESKALEIDKLNVNAMMEAIEHGARFESDALSVIQSEPLGGSDDDDRGDDEQAADEAEPDERPTLAEVLSEDVDPRLSTDGSSGPSTNGSGGDSA
jgi:hypothetical protein